MKRLALLLIVLFGSTLIASTPANARPPLDDLAPLSPTFKVKLHVAGGITITTHHDTTSECAPGQAWTIKEDLDVEINDEVLVTSFRNRLSSDWAESKGGARQASKLQGYRETNYCEGTKAKLPDRPDCEVFDGVGRANIVYDPRAKGKFGIGITRKGGGAQDLSCLGMTLETRPQGYGVTALQVPFTPVYLPTNLTNKSLKKLKKGKSLISQIFIKGPCKGAKITARPTTRSLRAGPDTCSVDGVFNLQVKKL